MGAHIPQGERGRARVPRVPGRVKSRGPFLGATLGLSGTLPTAGGCGDPRGGEQAPAAAPAPLRPGGLLGGSSVAEPPSWGGAAGAGVIRSSRGGGLPAPRGWGCRRGLASPRPGWGCPRGSQNSYSMPGLGSCSRTCAGKGRAKGSDGGWGLAAPLPALPPPSPSGADPRRWARVPPGSRCHRGPGHSAAGCRPPRTAPARRWTSPR